MPAGLGYTFAPETPNGNGQSGNGLGRASGLSPSESVKLLQLRVPERPAASALAPQALLQGGGGGGSLNALVQALVRGRRLSPTDLQALLGGGSLGPLAAQGGGPQPRITPGIISPTPDPNLPLSGPTDVPQGLIDRALGFDLGGGRTLGGGGGFAGGLRDHITGKGPELVPPLF